MKLKNASVALAILATAVLAGVTPSAMAQQGTPSAMHRRVAGRRGMSTAGAATTTPTGAETLASMQKRLQDMQTTLIKMHAVLKQMRAKALKAGPKDSVAKADVDMWALLLGNLDSQFEEMRATTIARTEMESRRDAMVKEMEARKAAQAGKTASSVPAAGGPSVGQTPVAGQAATTQPASTQPASSQSANPVSSPN